MAHMALRCCAREQQEGVVEILGAAARHARAVGVGLLDASIMPPAENATRASDAEQQSDALHFGDRRTRAQHVVILLLDLFENPQAAAAEQIEIDGQAAVHHAGQRQSFEEKLARVVHGLVHDGAKAGVKRRANSSSTV